MSLNVEELINRYKERAEAVKNRSIPPVGEMIEWHLLNKQKQTIKTL